jgi:hypothetical protein
LSLSLRPCQSIALLNSVSAVDTAAFGRSDPAAAEIQESSVEAAVLAAEIELLQAAQTKRLPWIASVEILAYDTPTDNAV